MVQIPSLVGLALLRPVVALNAWTLVMEAWMYAVRLPAIGRAKTSLQPESPPGTLDAMLPPRVQWKAHNYNHLHEQPTCFYAVALTLALLGEDNDTNVALAWGYVGLRMVHSLVQATSNTILVRFSVFAFSSVVLASLTVRTVGLLY